MARKKKPPEHENLERWLVSYADFMTLLFSTFVVLYALSQIDIDSFSKLQDSIRQSFTSSFFDASDGMMDKSDTMVGSYDADAMIMLEYLNQKYEEESFEDIKNEIEKLKKEDKDFENISVEINERGMVIKFTDTDMLFKSGSAQLTASANRYLTKVGAIIYEKFKVHFIRVEGHTDNLQVNSVIYPSNWELSSARSSAVVRFLIKKYDFNPALFTAVGLAEFRPIADNNTEKGRAENRRIEIVILRNKFKKVDSDQANEIGDKILKIESLKLSNSAGRNKVNFGKFDNKIDTEVVDIIPKQELVIFDDTYKRESQRLEGIQRTNRSLFKTRK